ncbi:T-lymphocyte surface antigen Ly-9-like isoform X1 [Tamandua tetradactyla]|uniref:T-lymphocyte surface antigen Ly-9-like isoform X1 n=1 Tax=Tamandua tetradactyla TaxID=48850 RepID=UPI00405382FD
MFDSLNRGSDRRQTPKSEAAYCSISVSDVQPAMGPGSEDSHPCWMSWLLTFLSLVLGVRSTGTKSSGALGSGTWNSEGHSFLKQIRGGSVLFHVIPKLDDELDEVSWVFGPESDFTVLLCFKRGADGPTWVSLQDKDKQRVHVPNMTSLRIEKLTLTDSGQYRARSTYTGGKGFTQVFHLTVCEPVPQPQMQAKPLSITANWCNVTLECPVTGATEDLNVTWEGKDLPGGVELRGTWGPVSNTSTLSVSLPLSQPNASITCVISNSVDQKNASLALQDVCIHGECDLPGVRGVRAQRGQFQGVQDFSPIMFITYHLPPGDLMQGSGRHVQIISAFKCLSDLSRLPFPAALPTLHPAPTPSALHVCPECTF